MASTGSGDPAWPMKVWMKSPLMPMPPARMVGTPRVFFAQPARLSGEPSNSGVSQRSWETLTMSTPASTKGASQASNACGVSTRRAVRSADFHCEMRKLTAKSGPTAARTALTTSMGKRLRSLRVAPPQRSVRLLVSDHRNWSSR
ncbi:MAG: hypothetical protein K0R83_3073 [Caulobacter sp.]|nr:hypothetical protein [Caulobacter sp.]